MNENGKIVTALLAGLAAGAVLGLLFAPEKGSETRDKINESLADLGDAIKERAEEQFDQLNELKEKLVSTLKSKAGKAEAAIDDEIEEHA
ncbi:gas vesicle protein [Sphingobacterium allocomposti]|jgi:gas vesicle protein|uniref:Gas vesicle protein n=1 Tax=Sphingobacterium allocomposti TaxID=415956 RepID=A0A5S5DG99_9SPHI|nr:YtxH domain-containing protein [Sphingobacterium composti Yoo et al. 2007 non Ten et al. 2007]TYP94705.1 gas vesicle protein [Sphingobacterium composti Yoo et al. 2007 non Ten et al. 2007]HLS94369.1 YtxH domain-containing protein [Sphingobacterium sp.]